MTDKTYTEQEVREAVDRCRTQNSNLTSDDLIAELNRPKVSFSEGEVVAYQGRDGDVQYLAYQTVTNMNWRGWEKLTHSEHSAEVRELVEAAEWINNGGRNNRLALAIAAYRSAHGGNEQ